MKGTWILLIMMLGAEKILAGPNAFPVMQEVIPDTVKIAQHDSTAAGKDLVPLRKIAEGDTLVPVTYRNLEDGRIPVVYLPDSLIRDTLHYEYTKIKDFAYKNKLTRELYKLMFIHPKPGCVSVMPMQNSEERFRDFRGKIISGIAVKVLPPFGTSVHDTAYREKDMGWLKVLANKMHMSTAEGVIRRQLTIRPGMRLVPFEVVQNEILLRELDYIDDVAVSLIPNPVDTSRVEMVVICKDQLSWGGAVESNFLNSLVLGIENKNFLKLGHMLGYEISYRGTKEKKWGNILEYRVNSLWGSHINLRGFYRDDYREKQVRLDIERKFLTGRMKWGGGIGAGRVYYSEELPDRKVRRLDNLFNYRSLDVWMGRSFLLPFRCSYNRNTYATARFFTTLFNRRPEIGRDTNYLYYNRKDYFAAFTYTKIKFYKANLIYDFGRTEDIPAGLYLGMTAGFEQSEFDNYGYLAAEARYSHFNEFTGRYYSLQVALGSFLGSGGFERGIFKTEANHISDLCALGNLRFRFYNKIRYVRGIRRSFEDDLYLEDWDIRGFLSDTLRGNQKLSAMLSTTFFLPYIKKGFRISVSSHVDIGVLAREKQALMKSRTYWGIGIGLNLRNDNVAIKNLSFRFTFYPTIPDDGRRVQAIISGGKWGKFCDYRVTKPGVIPYE